MPEAYTAEKMTVKKGDYIIHDERDAGGYGFTVVHFKADVEKMHWRQQYSIKNAIHCNN